MGYMKATDGCARQDGNSTKMNPAIRFGLVASLCASVAACGFAGGFVLALEAERQAIETRRCQDLKTKGITVTEPRVTTIPANEGEVVTFAAAYWRPESEDNNHSNVPQVRNATEGTLVITELSILMVPPTGTAGIRIPYEVVLNVELQQSPVTGEPRSTVVRSCFGRIDTFAFARRQEPIKLDPETTAASAAKIKARVDAFHAAEEKGNRLPK